MRNFISELPRRGWKCGERIARSIGAHGFRLTTEKTIPKRDFFSISIYEGASPFELLPASGANNPVLTGRDVTDLVAVYVADPFMIRDGPLWYMFFEILKGDDGKGVIGLAASKDGLVWDYRQMVLEEPFHLSYPYVFAFHGDYYMIPESHAAKEVRLYKAVDFPTGWEHISTLLEDVELVDCSPFHFQNTWWLFAGCGPPPCRADTLRLFHSDKLTGPWNEHPCSPIITNDATNARPGGRVVTWNDRLFRFAQDCHPYYGLRVRAFEILELTLDRYSERISSADPVLKAEPEGWNSSGMHHIDPHHLENGRCIACVDGWYWGPIPSGE